MTPFHIYRFNRDTRRFACITCGVLQSEATEATCGRAAFAAKEKV